MCGRRCGGAARNLRTCYPDVDGVGTQMVVPAARARIELAVQSVSERDLPEVVTGCLGVGFDVTGSPPLRVRLLRLSDVEHVLVVVVHHIAADGFSMGPLARDVMRHMRPGRWGRPPRRGIRSTCSMPTTRCGSGRYSDPKTIRIR